MPKPYLLRKEPIAPGSQPIRLWTTVMVFAVCLGGCAGSSGNTASSVGYDSEGALTSLSTPASGATAFTPTGAAVHSKAASEAAETLTSAAKPGNSAYKIGPLDVLDISVFKVPDLNKTVPVTEDGTITYPLLGEVEAAGKTTRELEQDLKAKLASKYLRNPEVTVTVKEYNSARVTVLGSVKTVGIFSLKGKTTLVQVVAMSGDIDTSTDSGDVVVFRTVDGVRSAARFNIDDIKAGKAEDPLVQPGDVIVAETSATKATLANIMKVLPLVSSAVLFSAL